MNARSIPLLRMLCQRPWQRVLWLFFGSLLIFPLPTAAQPVPDDDPANLDLEQRLGTAIPLDLKFTDSSGNEQPLRAFFGRRPVVLVLGYYECPNLCTLVLNATSDALASLTFRPGRDYDLIFVSIDPEEDTRLAAANKRAYARHYGKPGTDEGWHFLTGEAAAIRELADTVGFRYAYDEASGQYAHPSGLMVVTPEGVLAKYFYGIEFNPRDLRLGLVEAADGKVGSPVDQLLLLCFHYNPLTGQYGLIIDRVIKAAGAATVLLVGLLILVLLRNEKKRDRELMTHP